MDVAYIPIDICQESVDHTISEAKKFDRTIHVVGMVAEYTQAFTDIRAHRGFGPQAQFFFFPGANIGNFSDEGALEFMTSVSELMGPEDLFMVGFDLMKDIAEMQPAYDDAAGVTAKFNLNLLTRLNRECGANFDLSHFVHHPYYDPVRRAMVSWIVSTKDQAVTFTDLPGFTVNFQQGQGILVEQSRKCTIAEIHELARAACLTVREVFTNGLFADVVFVRE